METPEPLDGAFWSPRLNDLLPKRRTRKTALLAITLRNSCSLVPAHPVNNVTTESHPSLNATAFPGPNNIAAYSDLDQTNVAPPSYDPTHVTPSSVNGQTPADDHDIELLSLPNVPVETNSVGRSNRGQHVDHSSIKDAFSLSHSHPPEQSTDRAVNQEQSSELGLSIFSPADGSTSNPTAVYNPTDLLEDVMRGVRQSHHAGRSIEHRIAIDEVLDQVTRQFALAVAESASMDISATTPDPTQGPTTSSSVEVSNDTNSILLGNLDRHFHNHGESSTRLWPANRSSLSAQPDSRFGHYARNRDDERSLPHEPRVMQEIREAELPGLTHGGCIPFLIKESREYTGLYRTHDRGVYLPSPLRRMICVTDVNQAGPGVIDAEGR